MNKGERAIKALREAADALEELPVRWIGLLGPVNSVENLREEADRIQRNLELLKEVYEDEDHHDQLRDSDAKNRPD